MKREILFRGKRKANGEWIYGYYYQIPQLNIYEILTGKVDITNGRPKRESYEVIPETVGQDTECNDIDGDSIFEGMTVNQKSAVLGDEDIDFTGEVKFYDGSWWIDNGNDAILLCNEIRENKIIED